MGLPEKDKSIAIKRSAELLKQGATMLSEQCPKCGSPLFKLKNGDTVCPVHGKIIIAREDYEIIQVSLEGVLAKIEEYATTRISSILQELSRGDLDEMEGLRLLREWVELLDSIKRLKKK